MLQAPHHMNHSVFTEPLFACTSRRAWLSVTLLATNGMLAENTATMRNVSAPFNGALYGFDFNLRSVSERGGGSSGCHMFTKYRKLLMLFIVFYRVLQKVQSGVFVSAGKLQKENIDGKCRWQFAFSVYFSVWMIVNCFIWRSGSEHNVAQMLQKNQPIQLLLITNLSSARYRTVEDTESVVFCVGGILNWKKKKSSWTNKQKMKTSLY